MDWLDRRVIGQVPGKVSGLPLIRRSRARPEDVLDLGLSEEEAAASFNPRAWGVHGTLDLFHRHESRSMRG